jgi:hypothetical protein
VRRALRELELEYPQLSAEQRAQLLDYRRQLEADAP